MIELTGKPYRGHQRRATPRAAAPSRRAAPRTARPRRTSTRRGPAATFSTVGRHHDRDQRRDQEPGRRDEYVAAGDAADPDRAGRPRAGRPVVATGPERGGSGLWRGSDTPRVCRPLRRALATGGMSTDPSRVAALRLRWTPMSVEQSPAERVSTVVDGVEVLGALSPSRAGDFMSCPLLYRYRTIDRLPEPFSPDAVRGTRRAQGARGPLRPAGRRPHPRAGARAAACPPGSRCSRRSPSWPRCSRPAASPGTAPTWRAG